MRHVDASGVNQPTDDECDRWQVVAHATRRGLVRIGGYQSRHLPHARPRGHTTLARLKRFERHDLVMTQANSVKQNDRAAVTLSHNP